MTQTPTNVFSLLSDALELLKICLVSPCSEGLGRYILYLGPEISKKHSSYSGALPFHLAQELSDYNIIAIINLIDRSDYFGLSQYLCDHPRPVLVLAIDREQASKSIPIPILNKLVVLNKQPEPVYIHDRVLVVPTDWVGIPLPPGWAGDPGQGKTEMIFSDLTKEEVKIVLKSTPKNFCEQHGTFIENTENICPDCQIQKLDNIAERRYKELSREIESRQIKKSTPFESRRSPTSGWDTKFSLE